MLELKNKPENKELQEYILALEDPSKKKIIDIGNAIFPSSVKIQLETKLGEKLEKERVQATLKTLKDKYKVIFTLDEIKKEQCLYDLTFTESRYYQGNYSYDYIEKISNFISNNNLNISINDLQYHFYVLTDDKSDNPLIFYRHVEAKKYYFVLIDGDRKYVNIVNYIKGLYNYSRTSRAITVGSLIYLSLFTITSIVIAFLGVDAQNFIGGFIACNIVILFLIFIISAAIVADISNTYFNNYKILRK